MSALFINNITLVGRIGAKPITGEINNENKFSTFNMATSIKYTKQGEVKESTQWHKVCVYNNYYVSQIENIEKGSLVLVMGRLEYKEWTTPEGHKKKSAEIIVSTSRDHKFIHIRNSGKSESNKSLENINDSDLDQEIL